MTKRLLPAIVLTLLPTALAQAQTGGLPCAEFPVNSFTTGDQHQSSIAAAPGGNFVVVWNRAPDALTSDIFGRRFSPGGEPQGGEFQVNTTTTNDQGYPRVAFTAGGGFVVAWESYGQDGSHLGLFGQRFNISGVAQGAEFPINTTTFGPQIEASIGAVPGGGFVVAWTDYGRDDGSGIFGQRFDATGPVGPEFLVNSYTTSYQYYSRVATNAAGAFVVVWMSAYQDGDGSGIFAQRYDATGLAQGAEFQVNSVTTGYQSRAKVAFDTAGNFMVVWQSPHDGDSFGIFGQRYDSVGVPQGTEFQINAATTGAQFDPEVTGNSLGGFVVTWSSTAGDGSAIGTFGRRVSATGVPLGPEFRVNTYTAGDQFGARVAATPLGGFVVSWVSNGQDGSQYGVSASLECGRLYTVTPCRLVDTRNPPGPTGGPPLGANTTRTFPISGACGIPADARSVVLNVTAVNPTDVGNLRLYPAGQTVPLASSINFAPGRSRANNALVPLGTNGQVSVQCDMAVGSTGFTNLVLDVFGYFKR